MGSDASSRVVGGLATATDWTSLFAHRTFTITMDHPIYHVTSVTKTGPYTLRVGFNDDTEQTIDFRPVLAGAIYGPLRDETLFNQVKIDAEVRTLVWPNGADFDPATLHDWPKHAQAWAERAKKWELIAA
jgi:hypothetical protein